MKNTAIALVATFSAIGFSATAHAAATFEKVASTVETGAFANADDKWRRIIVNRFSACGAFGDGSSTRLDVIIDRYNDLAEAVSANNEAAAMEAGKAFASTVNQNERFGQCWDEVSHRVGVSTRLASMF